MYMRTCSLSLSLSLTHTHTHTHTHTKEKRRNKKVAVQTIDNIKPYRKQAHVCSEQNNTTLSVVAKIIGLKFTKEDDKCNIWYENLLGRFWPHSCF